MIRVSICKSPFLQEPVPGNLRCLRCESSALLVGEPKLRSAQLFAQGSVFLLEIFDVFLLVPIDPAREDQHQKLRRQSVQQFESRSPNLEEMGRTPRNGTRLSSLSCACSS